MDTLPPVPEMERAYQNSDASYDGIFYLGVRTTGIFCRPSCPARKPFPHHVAYYASPRDALFAGFRPCKRCHPMEPVGSPPEWVSTLLAEVEQDPSARLPDSALKARGIDPARARRYFVAHYGMTFQAFLRGRRMEQALAQIREGVDLDEVSLGNGYESHSGFREAFNRTFGLAPGRAQSADCIRVAMATTPLGPMVIGATSEGLCLAEFTNRRMLKAQFKTLQQRFQCAIVPGSNGHLEQAQRELDQYFARELSTFTLPLVYPGTPFQQEVWELLKEIPYGQTRSYAWLAERLGRPEAVRAVGTANGMNRIALWIPCHRVVNKNGKLGGYGGGIWRKQALLELERGQRAFFEKDFNLAALQDEDGNR